jgi:glycosyltransferase involved in cell wall biosynthesis
MADASNVDDIAAKIHEALTNTTATQQRTEAARQRAQTFTWAETARKTLKAYQRIAS